MAEVDDDPKRKINAGLKNIDKDLNAFINGLIAKFQSDYVTYKGENMAEVMNGIHSDGFFGYENKIKAWLRAKRKKGVDYSPGLKPGQKDAYPCKFAYVDWWVDLQLADVTRVNGVLIGTDKIGHYFTQGFQYWQTYVKEGGDKKAVEMGESQESTYYGLWASGLYSKADLAANKAGLAMYKRLYDFLKPTVADPDKVTKEERAKLIEKFKTFTVDLGAAVEKNWNEFENPGYVDEKTRKALDQAGLKFHKDAKYYKETVRKK